MEALATNEFFLSKGGPLATRIWTLAPTKSAQQSVLNLVLEIRANGQRTNASDFRVLRLPKRNEFCAAEFVLIYLPIRVLQESVNRAKSETKNRMDLRAV